MKALQLFHQGQGQLSGGDGWLWMNSATGVSGALYWTGDAKMPNTGLSAEPSAVVFKDKVYVFHQGQSDSGWLWMNVFDGKNWAGDAPVHNTGIGNSPSAVVFRDKLYVFHRGQFEDVWLYVNVFDGTNWAGDAVVYNTGMEGGPSAVVFHDKIYVFHQGRQTQTSFAPGWLYVNVFDGTNWSGDAQVPNTGLSQSPSAVVFNDKLYVFHQGQGQTPASKWLWWNNAVMVRDVLVWAGDAQVPNTGMFGNPSAVTFDGKLYVFHQGQGIAAAGVGDGWLWMNVFDGKNWSGDAQVPNTGLANDGPGGALVLGT
jgi:hypothetical protein